VGEKIRVLVVDDSAAIRRIVSDAINQDPDLELAGTAPNGKIALEQLGRNKFDAITLDVEMPELDGLQTLKAIRQTHRTLPVIMFSALTERGARTTIEALTAGANDYLCKTGDGAMNAVERVRAELIPRLKALVAKARSWQAPAPSAAGGATSSSSAPAAPPRISLAAPRGGKVELIAIGVSTGGPQALGELLPRLPVHLPVPVLIVQHMPALFTRMLAERLASQCKVRVEEARSGQQPEPGLVLIAPGDYHMVLGKEIGTPRLSLNQNPHENGCRPAVDPMFKSVAEIYGERALGLILTGMGVDGLRGAEAIRSKGGRIWTQDEHSSVVWGMAGAVSRAGLAEQVLPLGKIAEALTDATRHSGRADLARGTRGA
jgi:two-component system, chemotaxis family, protein-glutamate methylesterase/glutaminase